MSRKRHQQWKSLKGLPINPIQTTLLRDVNCVCQACDGKTSLKACISYKTHTEQLNYFKLCQAMYVVLCVSIHLVARAITLASVTQGIPTYMSISSKREVYWKYLNSLSVTCPHCAEIPCIQGVTKQLKIALGGCDVN